jgi:hypothetical protein
MPLGLTDLGLVLGLSSVPLVVVEVLKWLQARKGFRPRPRPTTEVRASAAGTVEA